MLKLDLYHAFYFAISQAFLGSFVMLLIDFRKPVTVWRTRWIATVVLVVGANLFGLLFLNFWDLYQHVYIFTVTLPYIFITLWCSQHRDFRAVFSIITGLFVGCIGTANAMLTTMLLKQNEYCEYYSFAVRTFSFFLMFFVLRRFSIAYRQMLHQLNRSWGILCLIPFAAFITMLYIINNFENSVELMVLIYGMLAVCSGAYYLMYLFFERVQKENSAHYEAQLSVLQLSALQSRMEAVRAAEDAIRMERHDLRHRLQTATEMVARGDKVAALDFLDAAQKRLDEGKAIRWCRPPVAQKAGHGLGVQSISAFCRKNGAVCQFDLTDGWFRLRLVL